MKQHFGELVGTFVLVFGGVGTAVVAGAHADVAIAFGFSIMAMIYTVGPISGCHVNRAVTLGVLLTKKISVRDV